MDVVAIGVRDVDLHDVGAGHMAQARFDPVRAQRVEEGLIPGGPKGHVLHPHSVIACGRVLDLDQMHDGRVPEIEPSAGDIERRAGACVQVEHLGIPCFHGSEIGGEDIDVVEGSKGHGAQRREVVLGCEALGSSGRVSLESSQSFSNMFRINDEHFVEDLIGIDFTVLFLPV